MGRQRIPEHQKLSSALTALHNVLGAEKGVVKGSQLKQAERELLLKNGFLREIIKGWYFVSEPSADEGDATPFFANYWEYLSRYLEERFQNAYCLSAEHSLLMHSENNVIPLQVTVTTTQNVTQKVDLYDRYSIFIYPSKQLSSHREVIRNTQCLTAPACLVALGPRHFQMHANEIQIVMSKIKDPVEIAVLAEQNAQGVGRLIGAYRQVGQSQFAEAIVKQLQGLPFKVGVTEIPFDNQPVHYFSSPNHSALYARVKLLWQTFRKPVLDCKPNIEPINISKEDFLNSIEALKIEDAYHSLSIERYRVTPELIEKIAEGKWNSNSPEDKKQTDAMAAKGYLDAFKLVKDCAGQAYSNECCAAQLFSDQHQHWFQQLFMPSVSAGLLAAVDLIGYRRNMVFLSGSMHSPPHFDYVADGMAALKECIAEEQDGFVRAVLSHFLMGYIHPFIDGNGRSARFTMNVMLAEDRYPWVVIPVEDRQRYMKALESASVENDIRPFAQFLSERITLSHRKLMAAIDDDMRAGMTR